MNSSFALKIFALVSAVVVSASATGIDSQRRIVGTAPIGKVKCSDFRIRDPFVLVDGGHYYLYESKPWSGGNGVCVRHRVCVRRSTDLVNWTAVEPAMVLPDDVHATAIWAPEVHKYNGRYYLFTTITEKKGTRDIKPMGREAKKDLLTPRGTWIFVADRPTGPFKPVKKGPIPPAEFQTLDGTLLVEEGKPYMVYCHEWIQMGNGTIEYAPLAPDFASFLEPPKKMLDAQSAMKDAWVVTDGPFFYKSEKDGRLYMIWSNMLKGKGYCVFVRSSESGSIKGPWSKDEILFEKDGGHGMIFKDLNGRLRLTLHQPNQSPNERMKLFELTEENGHLLLRTKRMAGD